ncbi:MAG: LytTR family DNA-binding domain-containing protein [Ruminococcus sp.]|nr:LytTR family DNA-binding domain-containing protein [Ruminococcus sp.]
MYHIVLCDDENTLIAELKSYLRRYADEHKIEFTYHVFYDGTELLANYNPDFDLIFLDIKMSVMNGIETAQQIRKTDSNVGLIFLTSITQYVWQGYEVNAVNYLIKPLKYVRLKMELDRYFARYRGKDEQYLAFSNGCGKFKVLYKDIRYAETNKRNVLLHFEDKEQIIYQSMKEFSAVLEKEPCFARCHASFLVNLAYVKSVENLEAVLTTGERIPVSQPKRKDFMIKMTDYWGNLL